MTLENSRRSSGGARSATKDAKASEDGRMAHLETLIEKRRMQNRISQRNYRNKLRGRIEHLEALVNAQKKEPEPKFAGATWGQPAAMERPYPALGTSPNLVPSSSGSTSPDDVYSAHMPFQPDLFHSQALDPSPLLADINPTTNPLNLMTDSTPSTPEHKNFMGMDSSSERSLSVASSNSGLSSVPMMSPVTAHAQFPGMADGSNPYAFGQFQLPHVLANAGLNFSPCDLAQPGSPVAYVPMPVFVVGGEAVPDMPQYVYVPVATGNAVPDTRSPGKRSESRNLLRREEMI